MKQVCVKMKNLLSVSKKLIVHYADIQCLILSVCFDIMCYCYFFSDSNFLQHLEKEKLGCKYHNGMFKFCKYFTNLSISHANSKNISKLK